MILEKLYVFSLIDKQKLKEYKINNGSVNIILGIKKDGITEGNGAGKTTFIECINTLLGGKLPDDFIKSVELLKRDVFIVLKVEINKKIKFIGRRITDSENGYILNNNELTLDLDEWIINPNDEFKNKVEEYNYGQNNKSEMPSFAQVREYLIRNEKLGFNSILLDRRSAIENNRIIAFLSMFPCNTEKHILKYKGTLKELNKKKKLIDEISGEIKELKISKKKVILERDKLQNIVENTDISKKISVDRERYRITKLELSDTQNKIYKLEKIKEQYQKNINNLEEKISEIKKLNDVEQFYQSLVNYFPNQLKVNYSQIQEFYDFMLDNRGEYFSEKINELDGELEELVIRRAQLQQIIEDSTKVLQQDNIVEDINVIVEELNNKNMELAEINIKIDYFNQKKNVNTEINKIKSQMIKKLEEEQKLFEEYLLNKQKLSDVFDSIVDETYKDEKGVLEYEIEQNTNSNRSTGRIKAECQIEDEKSHGRHYMKINMFDITLLLNRVSNNGLIKYLIHDGSYCKPDDKFAKGRLIRYVDKLLGEKKCGQYIITANIDEFNDEDIKWFKDNNKIIANLDREDDNKNRFFGFKY